ncbi:MAG: hypothetical protein PHZ06_10645 [Proteiniphilum sp.]|nr:hypothetical protein [Proteiniphilum sp.]MDD4453286.1 hypothetical protein [Proteiniphilum sp.]
MSSYTAKNAAQLRAKAGTPASILASELKAVDDAIDTAKIQYALLTAGMGTRTAVATSGVDIASGANAVYYGVFHAAQAMTILGMVTVANEAYKKDATDAKVILKDRAATPVVKCTYTLPTTGLAAKTSVTTAPTSAALAAGDILDLYITASGNTTGTGHVDVLLKYTVD